MAMPTIIFVNGLPATGKSTLAAKLGRALSMPVFGKDQIKETLFDTLGWSDREWSRKLGIASIAILFRMLECELAAGRSCIAESNFHPALDVPRITELIARHPARCIQVLCFTDGDVLRERYTARVQQHRRHPGHLDAVLQHELADELARGRVEPMALGGRLIEFDTTHASDSDVEKLIALLRAELDAPDKDRL